jgi:hypothetical protein
VAKENIASNYDSSLSGVARIDENINEIGVIPDG